LRCWFFPIPPLYVKLCWMLLMKMIGINLDRWDYLASCLALRDNFAVNVEEENIKGVDFYILMCTKVMHTLQEPFKRTRGQ
jgi:hypothetical protein